MLGVLSSRFVACTYELELRTDVVLAQSALGNAQGNGLVLRLEWSDKGDIAEKAQVILPSCVVII